MIPSLRNLVGAVVPLSIACAASPLAAQHLSLKTVPIPVGEQFLLFPSRAMGMGSVSIALDDPLLDPFSNPARSAEGEGVRLFSAPVFYGASDNQSGGRTLPLGANARSGALFGGFAVAIQQLDVPQSGRVGGGSETLFRGEDPGNRYLFGTIGHTLGARTSIGISGLRADLSAVDGVNRLYMRSWAIEQSGSLSEIRGGLAHQLSEGRSVEAVVLRANLDMRHMVEYWDRRWNETQLVERRWTEENLDRTTTWGGRVRYTQPLEEEGWRVGLTATANRKSHPKIPNYDLVNIPRDPGNSRAFALGAGLGYENEGSLFGVDVAWEPGRSHTWAYAIADTVNDLGATIPAGGRTVDNRFEFSNLSMAVGMQRENTKRGFQLGLRVRSIRYELDQMNYLRDRRRQSTEGWTEWTPTWSGVLKFSDFDVRYSGRATMKGFDELLPIPFGAMEDEALSPGGVDFVVAPTDPVRMPDFRVTAHQFSVVVPLGGRPRSASK